MCCGKGPACDGVPIPVGHHRLTSPDPYGLHIEAEQVRSSSGRGDSTAAETRARVAVQTQEVPWFFARTTRPEGIGQHTDNTGELRHVPRFVHQAPDMTGMLPWAPTHPTVLRLRPPSDDGLGDGVTCR